MIELYGSISKNPGDFGFKLHNLGFQSLGLNKYYKPFKVDNLEDAMRGVRALGIKGVGVSSPYKRDVLSLLDFMDSVVESTMSCNTVVNKDGILFGYNTDYFAVEKSLRNINSGETVVVCGSGGYAQTVWSVCENNHIPVVQVMRSNWGDLDKYIDSDGVCIFNATPVVLKGENVINASILTITGRILAYLQGKEQFRIYTNENLPYEIISELLTAVDNLSHLENTLMNLLEQ
jgi:shikimate 5-dehydrogenase